MFYPNINHECVRTSDLYLDKTSTAHFILTLENACTLSLSYIVYYTTIFLYKRLLVRLLRGVNRELAHCVTVNSVTVLMSKSARVLRTMSEFSFHTSQQSDQQTFIQGNNSIVRYIA